jgi:hypothetical protein
LWSEDAERGIDGDLFYRLLFGFAVVVVVAVAGGCGLGLR